MDSSIHLSLAYFCLSCESITDNKLTCPVCGNTHLWPLQKWLGNGKTENLRAAPNETKVISIWSGNAQPLATEGAPSSALPPGCFSDYFSYEILKCALKSLKGGVKERQVAE